MLQVSRSREDVLRQGGNFVVAEPSARCLVEKRSMQSGPRAEDNLLNWVDVEQNLLNSVACFGHPTIT